MKPIRLILLAICVTGFSAVSLLYALAGQSAARAGNRELSREDRNEAWNALQFLSASRAFPDMDIPEDAYQKAYEDFQTRFVVNRSLQRNTVLPWQNIGPNNVGGRTIGIAVDPNDTSVVWLGSASGGLWKSTTGGTGVNAWTYIPTGYPVRGVSCIALDPGNSNNLYIGTGETYSYGTSVNGLVERPTRGTVGIGILKSTDGGITWAPSLNWQYNQLRGVWDIQINPLKTSEIYAATTEGIYKSNNSGGTWTQVLNQTMVMNLVIDPVDTNTLYAGVGNVNSAAPGIYQTSNSGGSWTRLTNGLPPATNTGRITLAINPQNHRSLIALVADLYDTQGIYRSTDKGQTWNSINGLTEIVSYQGWYAKGLCFKNDDSTRVMFGGVYLFLSDLTGNYPYIDTSSYYIHPDIHGVISNPHDPDKIYVITDGGLFRSDDFGVNFYDCNDGYVTSQAYIGSVSAQDGNIMLSGLQDNNTVRYSGSPYWDFVIGGDGSFNAIDPTDDYIQYGSYQYLNILQSSDRGNSFNNIFQHPSSAFGGNTSAFVAPFILCNSNVNVLYAGADTLYRSDDGGFSWNPVSPGPIDAGNVALSIAASSTNEDSLYICTAPSQSRGMHVFCSGNGGHAFTDVSAGLPNRYPRDLAVDPQNSQTVYVAFSGFGTGHLFKSINAGTTWNDISTTLPNVPFHCITIDPQNPDTLFAGSDLGIFVSTDGGSSWDAYDDGLPDGTMVFDIQFSPADNSIVAFTHGNGTYKVSRSSLPVNATGPASPKAGSLTVVSNPVRTELHAVLHGCSAVPIQLSVFDMKGRCVREMTEEKPSTGDCEIQVDVNGLAPGTFMLKTIQGNRTCVSKFVKL